MKKSLFPAIVVLTLLALFLAAVHRIAPYPPRVEPTDTVALQATRSAKGNVYEKAQQSTVLVETDEGFGTGVIVLRGTHTLVITAKHVIEQHGKAKVQVLFHPFGFKSGGATYPAEILLQSEGADIAVLELVPNPGNFRGVEFDFTMPRVGDPVFHVGNFAGPDFDGTVSTGIISQVGVFPVRLEQYWPWALADSSTAANMRGCSGGGLFNMDGALRGIMVGNKEGVVFVHLPTRVLQSTARREGWEWILDPCLVRPSDAELKEQESYNVQAVGGDEPKPITLEDLIRLINPPEQKPRTAPNHPGRRTP